MMLRGQVTVLVLEDQMTVLMLGDQVAVLKTKNPVQQKPWCRTSVAEAVMQYRAAEAWMEEYSLC